MGVRVEQSVAGVASEAIDMPSVSGWRYKVSRAGRNKERIPTYLVQRLFPPRESVKQEQRPSQQRYGDRRIGE